MKQDNIYVNVASSDYVLENYINYDFHIFLLLSYLPIPSSFFFKYKSFIDRFRSSRKKAKLLFRNCKSPLPLPDLSVSHILCSHFLEHNFYDEAENILINFKKKLKVGGTLHLVVPNLDGYIDEYIASRENDDLAALKLCERTILTSRTKPSFVFRFLNFVGLFGLKHDVMFNKKLLESLCVKVGFKLTDKNSMHSSNFISHDPNCIHVYVVK